MTNLETGRRNPYSDLTIIDTALIEISLRKNRRYTIPAGSVIFLEGVTDESTHIDLGFLELATSLEVKLIGIGTNLPLKATPTTVVAGFEYNLAGLQTEADLYLNRFGTKQAPVWTPRKTPLEMFFAKQAIIDDLRNHGIKPEEIKGLHMTALLSRYPQLTDPVSSVNFRFRR